MSELIHFGLVKVVSFGTIGFSAIMTLVLYFIFDRGNESYMDLSFMIPFSWQSPWGYLFMLVLSAIDCFCSTTACTATICLFIGSSYVLITIAEDITNNLDHLNCIDSTNPNERQIHKQYTDVVRLYANLKELSDKLIANKGKSLTIYFMFRLLKKFSSVCGSKVLLGFLFTYVNIYVSLVVFLMQSVEYIQNIFFSILEFSIFKCQIFSLSHRKSAEDALNFAPLMFPLLQICLSFGFIAAFCELGETVTDQFRKFNARLYQCDWYLFPIEVQQMLVIFMSDTQQTVYVQGYGHVLCIRENLKRVKSTCVAI